MTKEIYNRAYEMIANGYEFGQIQNGDTWEHLIEGGPYSDIYTCAEKLKEEFGININMGLKYLKMAFKKYVTTHWDDDFEIDESKNMKNVVKLNEAQLRKVVAESVKKVLKENSSDTDSEIYQAIASFMDEIHRIITTDREAVEYYGEEIRDVQQSAIRLRDALIHPTQRRMGVSQGDLTYDYLS